MLQINLGKKTNEFNNFFFINRMNNLYIFILKNKLCCHEDIKPPIFLSFHYLILHPNHIRPS